MTTVWSKFIFYSHIWWTENLFRVWLSNIIGHIHAVLWYDDNREWYCNGYCFAVIFLKASHKLNTVYYQELNFPNQKKKGFILWIEPFLLKNKENILFGGGLLKVWQFFMFAVWILMKLAFPPDIFHVCDSAVPLTLFTCFRDRRSFRKTKLYMR